MKHFKSVIVILSLLFILALGQSDSTPPSITLASTATEISSPSTIFLAAVASDLGGIAKVEFYRGATKLFEASEAPYSLAVNLGEVDAGTVSFDAIAYDMSGNSTRSNAVSIAVNIGAVNQTPTTSTETQAQTGVVQANADSYTALVNTLLVVGSVTNSGMAAVTSDQTLVANDTGLGSSSAVTSESIKSSLGGDVALYTDGSFSYIPPVNVLGSSDSFSYTVSSGGSSSTATVTIQIMGAHQTGKVLYVSAASAGGNGHAASPFSKLSEAEAASEPGDIIVLQTGSYATLDDHQLSLKEGQQLLGQGKAIIIEGQTVLPASNPPILLRSGGSSLVLANNVVVSGITISRANATGNATDDTSAGSGASGIVIPAGLNGSVLIEDLSINYVGGFGVLVQTDGSPNNRISALTLNNVSIESPGFFAIAVDDVMNFTMNGGQINNLRNNPNGGGSGRGIAIEAEFDSSISISGVTVTSIGDNTKAIHISKNDSTGQSSSMAVTLSNNTLTFPASGADASVAMTIGYTDTATGTLTMQGQGNTTNSISPFFLSSSGSGVSLSGKILVNDVEYPK